MDKELEAIVEIEKKLVGLDFEEKHRVVDYVKARIKYDGADGIPTQGLIGDGTLNSQKLRP